MAEAQRQLNALLNLKLREMVDDALFTEKRAELQEEINRLRLATQSSTDAGERIRQSAMNTVRFLSQAHGRFLVGGLKDRREIARALGLSYRFDRGSVRVEPHPTLSVHLILEPLSAGSESQKRAAFKAPVPGGAPCVTTFGTFGCRAGFRFICRSCWLQWFKQVTVEELRTHYPLQDRLYIL